MRNLIALILTCLPAVALAQDWEDRRTFNPEGTNSIRILSSTDTALFSPVIEGFIQQFPDISIDYLVTGTADIDRIFRADPGDYDVVISSAMDLQLKLANDGLARQLSDIEHPAWAQWRQSVFGFTLEPAAIVINRATFDGWPIPQSRQDLIQAMRARPQVFQGRVGTYDIRRSGLGYLFATQDARASETYWRLMEVMGALEVRLYCCSGDMIDDLASGKIAVAYNVLGSYAAARTEISDTLLIVHAADFPTTMMRTALVSEYGSHQDIAQSFVKHLLSLKSGDQPAVPLPLLDVQSTSPRRETIALEPALLTFLDALKRRNFLAEWENAVIQQ